jgi:uncharacterized damage-inducible protein DinB
MAPNSRMQPTRKNPRAADAGRIDTSVVAAKGAPMKPYFLMMARYNAWANLRLYKMAGALPEELYRREVGVYFKSLHGTLNHLLVTDRIWMRRLTGEGSHPNKLNAIAFDDFASLQAARTSEDLRIVNYTENLQEADIEKELDYTTLNGTPQRQPSVSGLSASDLKVLINASAPADGQRWNRIAGQS